MFYVSNDVVVTIELIYVGCLEEWLRHNKYWIDVIILEV